MALVQKSNNQRGLKIGIDVMAQQPRQQKQQSKGIEDWHRCDGSKALAAKSNNQKG
jgi:hypothetical protein